MTAAADNRRKTGIGFVFAFTIIAAIIWRTGWYQIYTTIVQAHLPFLLLSVACTAGAMLMIGTTWWIIVKEVGDIALVDGLRIFLATMFANTITPFGQFGGEPFIAYILSRGSDTPYEESLGAVLAADVVNAIPFFTLTLTGISVFLASQPLSPLVSTISKGVIAGFIGLFLAVFTMWRFEAHALRVFGYIGFRIDALVSSDRFDFIGPQYLQEKGETLFGVFRQLLRNKPRVGVALATTHLAGLVDIAGVYLMLVALGATPPIAVLLFIVPTAMLASYLPLPGGMGGIEAAMTGLLVGVAGVPAPIALSAVLLNRTTRYIMSLGVGGFFASQLSIDIYQQ